MAHFLAWIIRERKSLAAAAALRAVMSRGTRIAADVCWSTLFGLPLLDQSPELFGRVLFELARLEIHRMQDNTGKADGCTYSQWVQYLLGPLLNRLHSQLVISRDCVSRFSAKNLHPRAIGYKLHFCLVDGVMAPAAGKLDDLVDPQLQVALLVLWPNLLFARRRAL